MLAISGKFPGEGYTDGRHKTPTGNLVPNLGRMPILEIDGQSLGQSAAINYYIASENGLMGSNTWEAAQIIAIHEHLDEMMTVFLKLIPWGVEPSPDLIEKWFHEGSTDISGPAERSGYSTRYLTWWMGRIEATLGDKGFAVGDKLSLADCLLYNVFGEFLKPEEVGSMGKNREYPFCSEEKIAAALAKHPKIKASVDAVANIANMQKWLTIRGVQEF